MKINKVNKARLLFWCIIIAIIVYVIADIDRQRSGQADVGAEENLNGKDFKVIENKIVEVEHKTEEQFLEKHRRKLEKERKEKQKAEEERLARVEKETKRRAKVKAEKAEQERLAKIEAEKVAAEKAEQARLAKVENDKKVAKQEQEPQVVANAEQPSRGGGRNLGTFQATAYCKCTKCSGRWSNSPTASGTTPKQGRTIAVDTSIIPMGSKVYIDGLGTFIAEDTGSAIVGNIVDIFYNNHSDALKFGRQNVTIRILD